MRTPRPASMRRGNGTLIGDGWLQESPSNVWPREWDIRSKSALRKCMLLPAVPGGFEASVSPAAIAPPPKRAPDAPVAQHPRDPKKDVRLLPAVSPDDVLTAKKRDLYAAERAQLLGGARPVERWYEDPIALGALLIMAPPVGLAVLWASGRYSNDARWALTVMTALTMCLVAAIAVAVIALRS